MELLLKAHKQEESPYPSVNQYVDKVEKYCKETTHIIIKGVCSILEVNKQLKKAKDDALIFKGRIQYSPKTGKPITMGEWEKLEQAIMKYLKIEKKQIQQKISTDSYWLGSILSRMDKQQRMNDHIDSIDLNNPDFDIVNFNDYDYDRIKLAEQFSGIYIQNVNDRTRSKIQQIILDGSRQNTSSRKVWQSLWDLESDVNRDWERLVRTEIPDNINNGMMTTLLRTSDEEHVFMKGISAPTACSHCQRLVNEQIVALVDKPIPSGMIKIDGVEYPAIWPGKSNFGRKPKDYWVASIIHPYCYSKDTELLTNEGWKYFYELNGNEKVFGIDPETKKVDWVNYNKIVSYNYEGKLINLKSKSLDLLVTPDHNNLIMNQRGSIRQIKTEDLKISHRLPKAIGKWGGEEKEFININGIEFTTLQYVKLMGWYLSEGSWNRDNYINIAQNNTNVIYEDLKDLPIPVQKGKTRIYIKSKRLNEYMRQFGHSKDKFVPEELKSLSIYYLKEFLSVYCKGDGTERMKECNIKGHKFLSYRRVFYTSSKKMESDIAELMIKIGKFPSFSVKEKGDESSIRGVKFKTLNDVFAIHETNSETVGFIKKKIPYSDKVYDIEMDKFHFFLVRRNGKAVWSGNCRCTWSEYYIELEQYLKP